MQMTPGGPHKPVHTVAKHPHHHKPRKFSFGFSDCAAQAVAQSLRATGRTVSDADIATLYRYTADNPDSGATILATLRAVSEHGLAGIYPASFSQAEVLTPGCLLGITLTRAQQQQAVWDRSFSPDWDTHTVILTDEGVWSWGTIIPVTDDFLLDTEEAWKIEWR